MTPLALAFLLAPPAVPPKGMDLATFEVELQSSMTAERAEAWAKELGATEKGAWARVEMPVQGTPNPVGRVAFMLRAPDATFAILSYDREEVHRRQFRLKALSNGLFAIVNRVREGEAVRYRYLAGGQPVGDERTFEAYQPPPESVPDPKVAKGELREMPSHTSEIYPGTTRPWWVYLPAKPAPKDGYALIAIQDGQWAKNYWPVVLDNMIAAGTLPPTVAVFVKPGSHEGKDGDNRAREYDVLSDEYARMLLGEILPKVGAIAPLTKDPSRRAIAGASSGGICAFTAAWERPESFGLVLSWIGSYVNIAALYGKEGGQNYPAKIRRTDRKPIRVVLQEGSQDLDNEWGNWPLANRSMLAALKYKSYDVKWIWGNGFHNDAHGRATLPESLRWLFRTEPAEKAERS